ncbi:MAG TPA: alpha/beta fold hydrolase [Solirubrobacterales bacterium]
MRRAGVDRTAVRAAGTCLFLAAVLIALTATPSVAATAHPGIGYDIDSPPAIPSQNQLDLYTPDGATANDRRPVVVYVHGGSWARGDKANQIQDKVSLFTGAGYVFVSLNYRLSPSSGDPASDPNRIKFPDQPHDVGEAIGWLSRHVSSYGGDPNRIALIGHSAGGQLVSLISTDPEYVAAYGVHEWQLIGTVSLDTDAYDIPHRIAVGGPAAQAGLYNAFGTPAENAVSNAWVLGSPIDWAGAMDPPFLLVPEAAVPDRVSESQRMAAALAAGSGASVFPVPYSHGGINAAVGGPADTAGETAAIMDFFSRAVASAKDPKAKLRKRPPHRIRAHGRRAKAKFRFKANVPGATFRCRLDKGKLKACKARRSLRVRTGRHSLRYQAISHRGRPGKVQKFKFRVD